MQLPWLSQLAIVFNLHTFLFILIDGHHKLIRWKFVTHGAIDGFSRLVVYLHCSGNNRASTVYDLFLNASQQYGLPSRIRCDQGGENIQVAHHMLRHRGIERRSVLVGSSVHNQRIERLWRDMHRCITSVYYRLFYFLEEHGLLIPINDMHIFSLHYVYLPRINQALQEFVQSWNHHGMQTERGLTPHQLFTSGSLRLQNAGSTALDFFEEVLDTYGIEDTGNVSMDSDEQGVEVPPIDTQISEQQMGILRNLVNPLESSEEFGIDLFESTKAFMESFDGL